MVRALSTAEIPVVIPSFASIDTVNPVPCFARLLLVIMGKLSLSHFSGERGRQTNPLALLIMKLIFLSSINSAAQTRSPSFSLSSSSSKITILPSAMSSISSLVALNSIVLCKSLIFKIRQSI